MAIKRAQIAQIPDPTDREIISMVAGSIGHYGFGYVDSYTRLPDSFQLDQILARKMMPLLAGTGRLRLRLDHQDQGSPLAWDDTGPWNFALELRASQVGSYELDGVFRRGDDRMQVTEPLLIFKGGLLFTRERVTPWHEESAFEWISQLRSAGSIKVPAGQHELLLASLLASRRLPPLHLPEELRLEEVTGQARARLRISSNAHSSKDELECELSFDYGVFAATANDPSRGSYDSGSRRFLQRDFEAEDSARATLEELGIKPPQKFFWNSQPVYRLRRTRLPRVVTSLVQAGWHIEAEGKIFRRPGASHLGVSSGVDWFELQGQVEYGECTAKLPALLEAVAGATTWYAWTTAHTVCCRTTGCTALPRWRQWARRRMVTFAFAAARPGCWMLCWPLSRRRAAMRSSTACAANSPASGVEPAAQPQAFASTANLPGGRPWLVPVS